MNEIPDEMMPNYKSIKDIKQNIFVEFSMSDWDFIKNLSEFLNAFEYKNMNELIHRREMGYIETDKAFIRFLGNCSCTRNYKDK